MSNREKINGCIIRNTTNVLVYCTFFLLNNPLTDMVGAMECKIVWKMSGMEMDLGSTWQKGSSYRKYHHINAMKASLITSPESVELKTFSKLWNNHACK